MTDKLHILIVDDDPGIRFVLEEFLAVDYTVSTAEDGEQAWEILQANAEGEQNHIDVVLSDMSMPKMDGLKLLKLIRQQYPDICVIMISGSSNTRAAIAAIREGAFDYIVKPFDELEVVSIIIEKWQRLQTLETKLSQYAALHEDMMQHMKLRSFLSIDVKDSAQMKIGADPFITQHAFSEYHNFVRECIEKSRGTIHSTAGDGIMTCFVDCQDAKLAASEILQQLARFNAERNKMRQEFKLRLGLHTGTAVVDENGTINSMFSESLDLAGHIQQRAEINRLEISEKALQSLGDNAGFEAAGKVLAGQNIYFMKPS